MTADTSLPPDSIPTAAVDGATGNDKVMKQFSRTDAERERATHDAAIPDENAGAEPAAGKSTQPPPSTAPANPEAHDSGGGEPAA